MKTKKRSARDLISYLPCDIIENILKRLILRDAVRTSILSREWRYKWATLPALILKRSSLLKLTYNRDLNTVINQILTLHQGPVKEFEVGYMDLESSHYLHQWFDLLSKYHLQRLFLHWWIRAKDYGRLPSNFFSFSQLRYLYLSKCVLRLPSSFKGLSRLVSFELDNVKIKSHKLSSLISESPFLERVVIRNYCNTLKALPISASKLKKFLYDGLASSIYFVNVPLLEEVHIVLIGISDLVLPDKKVKQDNFMKSLAQFSSITKLVLNCFLKSVALDGVWQNLTFDMNHLKILGLEISSYELAEVSCAICLIRSAPNLESLNFIISARDQQIFTTLLYLEQQREHNSIYFSGLKKVLIWWQDWKEEPDMELVKLIFSFSPALEKFFIPFRYEGSYILEELVMMPKASSKVEIVFDDTDVDIEFRVFDVNHFSPLPSFSGLSLDV